ncbi:hypothetical protein L0222_04505 [bacterium]|nr:hypothetical protein [bacterium]MCI0604167.1 hypothetical protein [bacterium]
MGKVGKSGSSPINPQPAVEQTSESSHPDSTKNSPSASQTESPPVRASAREAQARIVEKNFDGRAREAQLRSLLAKGGGETAGLESTDQQSHPSRPFTGQMLVPRQTASGGTEYEYIGPARHLNSQDAANLGRELAELRRADPDRANETVDQVFNRFNPEERQRLATELVRNTTHRELVGMAVSDMSLRAEPGQGFLERMNREMTSGPAAPTDQSNRIETARLVARARHDPRFIHFDSETDNQIHRLIERHQTDPQAVGNIIDVVTTPGFHGSPVSEQNLMLRAMGERPGSRELSQLYQGFGMSEEFRNLNSERRTEILEFYTRMERNGDFQGCPDRFFQELPGSAARLVSNPGYDLLTESDREQMLNHMGWDPSLERNFTELTEHLDFHGLDQDTRTGIIGYVGIQEEGLNFEHRRQIGENLIRFAQTESYRGMNPDDRVQAQNIIFELSAHSVLNPNNAAARNTLNHLVNGTVPMGIGHRHNDRSDGFMDNNTAYFNFERLGDRNEIVDTATHEVNHVLNGNTASGTRDRFLDEYRAWFVGDTAVDGNPPDAAQMRDVLDNLVLDPPGGSGYDHLRRLYRNDPNLRAVVQTVRDRLAQDPPVITSPEELRLMLAQAPGGQNSDYLNRQGNIDNH